MTEVRIDTHDGIVNHLLVPDKDDPFHNNPNEQRITDIGRVLSHLNVDEKELEKIVKNY